MKFKFLVFQKINSQNKFTSFILIDFFIKKNEREKIFNLYIFMFYDLFTFSRHIFHAIDKEDRRT